MTPQSKRYKETLHVIAGKPNEDKISYLTKLLNQEDAHLSQPEREMLQATITNLRKQRRQHGN